MKLQDPDSATEKILSQCSGAVGEVLTEDNRLLFVGRLGKFDQDSGEIPITLHRGTETPRGVIHGTTVKVQLHPGQGWDFVAVLYGQVSICASSYWRIAVRNVVTCSEGRRAFRQKNNAEGRVFWVEQGSATAQCRLTDISLVGVGFTSQGDFPIDARIHLSIPQLVENGVSYALTCTVINRRETEKNGVWHYGCEFVRVDSKTEAALCRDIFTMQARSVNRKR